ncbi:protein scylla-like [Lucilia cuprina]|uniref:protein scylla-like n=1 Tax=Lucilia cuprina TaxID=7375 RepID=UPI001F05F35B|nr:protein scylla-like [Lucilia cuprina]
MEILSVQNQYPERFSIISNTTKTKDWSTSLQTTHSTTKTDVNTTINSNTNTTTTTSVNNNSPNYLADEELLYCDKFELAAINDLASRLLEELRAAKSRNLTCTEVSIPCDLTTRIASEIIRVSEREPCGIRGCTLYIEFEEEPQNSRRIGTLKVDHEMVSTFELYLTLRQDKRGWASLLPQFMKNLSRSITISPEFSLTKHKLYSPNESS